jgi:hypothetical protein
VNGVIASLRKLSPSKPLFHVTASGSFIERDYPMNVADFASGSIFISKSGPAQWICYDFIERSILPTPYAIKSGNAKGNNPRF